MTLWWSKKQYILNNKNYNISILGTGWLGLPLAKALHAQGHTIKGSTTSPSRLAELEAPSITPVVLELTEDGVRGNLHQFLSESHTLIINIPPGLRRDPKSDYVKKITALVPHIQNAGIKKVLYISSTSVFAAHEDFPIITDSSIPDALSNAAHQLIQVEQLLLNTTSFATTILRFGGLFDARRHPATMLSRRKNIKNPEAPLNLIHGEDCIGIIKRILETNTWNEVFNAAYPEHPQKKTYYSKICEKLQLPTPDYDFQTPSRGKIITAQKVIDLLEYTFVRDLEYS